MKKDIEVLRNLLAFYMGEDIPTCPKHPIEREYVKLVRIPKEKRTPKQETRLIRLARAVMAACEARDEAFRKSLDNFS